MQGSVVVRGSWDLSSVKPPASSVQGAKLPGVALAPIGTTGAIPTPAAPAIAGWPLSKMRNAIRLGRGDRSFLAVMFLTGRMSPVHRGHLQAMQIARNRLEDLGYSVVGAWLSPSHEIHGHSNDLSASLRVKLARVATSDDSLIEVSTWECSRQSPNARHQPADIAEALKTALSSEFPKQKDWLYIFRVCGSDDYKEDFKSIDYSLNLGCIVIPRPGSAHPPPERKRDLLYVSSVGCASGSFTGAVVRQTIATGDLGVASLLPAGVARLITAPTGKEWEEMGKEFAKLGAKTPTSAAMRETAAPKIAKPKQAGPALPPPSATTPAIAPASSASAKEALPCPICKFVGTVSASYCSECGAKLRMPTTITQQPSFLLSAPIVEEVAPTFEPGGFAKQAGIVPPTTASLHTLQALDNIIKALQKRGLNLEKVFRLLDVDKSGALQKDEYMAAMQNFIGAEVSRDELIAMWMVADANQDGKVTLEEFLFFLGKLPSHVAEAKQLQAEKLGKIEEQHETSGPPLSPQLRHAVLKVWGVLANNAKMTRGPLDSWHVEWLSHPGSPDLMLAVAAWSPWDKHNPPERRSVRIADLQNALMDCTDLNSGQVSALATALGFAVGKAETKELLVPVIAANLQHLHSSIRDREKRSGGFDDVPIATGAVRIETALLGVQQLRKEAKRLHIASEPPQSEAVEAHANDLLYLGVDLTLPLFNDDDGCTLLMLAALHGWLHFCRSLCSSSAPSWIGGIRTYINMKSTGHDWTALLCSVWHRRYDVARLLLEFLADPNIPSCRGGVTPLMLAADGGEMSMCEALISAKADPLAKSCDSRDAFNFVAERLQHADVASHARFSAIFQLLDVASSPSPAVLVPSEAEIRRTRRRTKRVSYDATDQIRIQWRVVNGELEALVRSIAESDRAYEAGVRPGWALLLVNGDGRPLQDHSARLQTLSCLVPPITLDFGRPINTPEDLWKEQLSNMVNEKRQNPPSWKHVARERVAPNIV